MGQMDRDSMPSFSPHSLEQLAGRVLIGGFGGTSLDDELLSQIAMGQLGGLILFSRNLENPRQSKHLCETALAAAGEKPFWLAVDQEGGRVQRVNHRIGASSVPPMAQCAQEGEWKVRAASRVMACELSALGFNLNFAPVLDVHSRAENPVIGERAFSNEPSVVAQMGLAFAEEHLRLGMGVCGKHFPGHGDTLQDSHLSLPYLSHSRERLDALELQPFRAAIAAGFPMMMSAHIVMQSLDEKPATLSARILRELLREELGFEGVVVSDDLEMKGISAHWPVEEAAVMALEAGVDLLLVCGEQQLWRKVQQRLVQEGERRSRFVDRLLEATQRLDACYAQLTEQRASWIAKAEHRATSRHADTLLRVSHTAHADALSRSEARGCEWCAKD
ncbi:MAG: beta-N-acetylhexosaminidase [Myxococcota bacterium]|jgi:beta-N-acetylhexosaminidase|nr:beta-N-acetylhexosaminidase [Myxococcota bacterium]